MSSTNPQSGKVYLVGAGPGDPGLITLRGVECLNRANVVLYDYLVNPDIVGHAPGGCELICLGRHGHDRIWSHEEINARMIESAGAGKFVVRLKGGDPAVFARGADETEALAAAGIPFEVVPGITAALAASSYAGIPVTHRELASAVAFVTGQEQSGKPDSVIDFEALAKFPGTLVMYMGVTTVHKWTSGLAQAGMSPTTPAVIIRRCSFPDQSVIRCTLGEIVERLSVPRKIRPPVIVIIGEVALLPETLSWFEKRPCFGQQIMVTRPAEQVASLRQPLSELGAEVLVQPAIQIFPPDDWGPVDAVIDRLKDFDWLVFSSRNGVRFFLERLLARRGDIRFLGPARLAAMGPQTTAELRKYHLFADVQPTDFRAESLSHALIPDAEGRRILLLRASRGREVLAEELRRAGADVTQVVVYASRDVPTPDEVIVQRVRDGAVDWTTVTSSAIARSLASMFGNHLHRTRLASISPVTSETLRELGFVPAVEAKEYTIQGVVKAIVSTLKDG